MPRPEDYDAIEQQRRVDATFHLYHPETDAEVRTDAASSTVRLRLTRMHRTA